CLPRIRFHYSRYLFNMRTTSLPLPLSRSRCDLERGSGGEVPPSSRDCRVGAAHLARLISPSPPLRLERGLGGEVPPSPANLTRQRRFHSPSLNRAAIWRGGRAVRFLHPTPQ